MIYIYIENYIFILTIKKTIYNDKIIRFIKVLVVKKIRDKSGNIYKLKNKLIHKNYIIKI